MSAGGIDGVSVARVDGNPAVKAECVLRELQDRRGVGVHTARHFGRVRISAQLQANTATKFVSTGYRSMRTIRTPHARERFLDHLALTMNVTASAQAAGFGRRSAYDWRDDDPEFAKDWDDAIEMAVDRAEREAIRRAVEGVTKPIMYQGEKVGEVQEYSDRLLEFVLKGRRREVYGDKVETAVGLSDPLQRLMDEIAQERRSMRTIEHED